MLLSSGVERGDSEASYLYDDLETEYGPADSLAPQETRLEHKTRDETNRPNHTKTREKT